MAGERGRGLAGVAHSSGPHGESTCVRLTARQRLSDQLPHPTRSHWPHNRTATAALFSMCRHSGSRPSASRSCLAHTARGGPPILCSRPLQAPPPPVVRAGMRGVGTPSRRIFGKGWFPRAVPAEHAERARWSHTTRDSLRERLTATHSRRSLRPIHRFRRNSAKPHLWRGKPPAQLVCSPHLRGRCQGPGGRRALRQPPGGPSQFTTAAPPPCAVTRCVLPSIPRRSAQPSARSGPRFLRP